MSFCGRPVTPELDTSIRISGFSRWKSPSIGKKVCCNSDGGTWSRIARRPGMSSLIALSVRSIWSSALLTTPNNCSPSAVSESLPPSRSNSCLPSNCSSPATWRLIALCETESAAAPPVKLRCLPTASNARSALSGSQRRLITIFPAIVLPFPVASQVRSIAKLFDMGLCQNAILPRPAERQEPSQASPGGIRDAPTGIPWPWRLALPGQPCFHPVP